MHFRHSAQGPQGVLQPLAQALQAFGSANQDYKRRSKWEPLFAQMVSGNSGEKGDHLDQCWNESVTSNRVLNQARRTRYRGQRGTSHQSKARKPDDDEAVDWLPVRP